MTIYDNFHGFLKLRVNIFHFDRTIWVKLDSSWMSWKSFKINLEDAYWQVQIAEVTQVPWDNKDNSGNASCRNSIEKGQHFGPQSCSPAILSVLALKDEMLKATLHETMQTVKDV
jgi:hypothetical protein